MLNSEQIHKIILKIIGADDSHNHPSYAYEHCLDKESYIYVKHKPDRIVVKQPLVLHPNIINLKGKVDAIEGVETDWQITKNTSFRRLPKFEGKSQYGYAFNVENEHAIQQLLSLIGQANQSSEDIDTDKTEVGNQVTALNQILYGPPGTGKTYNTINQALAIVEPAYLSEHQHDRIKIKARFDELVASNRIGFVTFHQSFSYEDFVEGLKANSDNGVLSYSVESGVFKTICSQATSGVVNNGLNDSYEVVNMTTSLHSFVEELANQSKIFKTKTGKEFSVKNCSGFNDKVTITLSTDQSYDLSKNNFEKAYSYHGTWTDISNHSYIFPILSYLEENHGLHKSNTHEFKLNDELALSYTPYVLIIDEINRGNISNIFGELITLIEPSKRAGGTEALSVKLPYSKESFSVPSNLHIIGTMNTADKSLAQVDIALRRRFEFVEMMPKHELLEDIDVEGINIAKLLETINQRIELLYDREHTIGHSFFLPLKNDPTIERLARIFELEILPLLEEYFFEDWERVGQVLGDHLKSDISLKFIEEKFTEASVLALMGNDWSQDGIRPYQRNNAALLNPEAYKGIYDSQQG
ncbi:McrB family protein [Shewanella atlantica]|uniref:ATPase n=1 Tax=Shewanella atlantica TaxID=271099 RepID=A0A431WHF7_9GAMM|nr:AAA family ATPase [Shewanella atlantica]RTR34750.1 ATPase [Shewanella atlantica]